VLMATAWAVTPDDEEDEKKYNAAKEAVLKQAANVAKTEPAKLMGAGKGLAKTHELGNVMRNFKLRTAKEKPGLGVGEKGVRTPDGIEAKIKGLSKKVSDADLGPN